MVRVWLRVAYFARGNTTLRSSSKPNSPDPSWSKLSNKLLLQPQCTTATQHASAVSKQLQTRYLCASLSLSYTHTPLPVVQVRQVTLTPCCRLLELLHVNRAIAIPAYTHTHTQATEPLPSATVVRPSPFVMNRLHSNELTHQTCQTEPSPPSHHAPSDNTHTHTQAVGEGGCNPTHSSSRRRSRDTYICASKQHIGSADIGWATRSLFDNAVAL